MDTPNTRREDIPLDVLPGRGGYDNNEESAGGPTQPLPDDDQLLNSVAETRFDDSDPLAPQVDGSFPEYEESSYDRLVAFEEY